MKTKDVQKLLLEEIIKRMAGGGSTVARMRALSREVLALSAAHPDEIPPEKLAALMASEPEVTLVLRDDVRGALEKRDDDALAKIRRDLGLPN